MGHIHIDFETRSTVDLTKTGADVYSRHETTDVLCMAFAIDDSPVDLWEPSMPNPQEVLDCVRDEYAVIGHNVGAFEVLIWNNICVPRYGWPQLYIEQCEDTMAMAYSMALPGSLEKAAMAAGIERGKDMDGRRIMLQLCKPRDKDEVTWWTKEEFPQKYKILYDYCKQDVEVERDLYKRLMLLSKDETKLWHLDWRINRRGVELDVGAIHAAIDIVEHEKKRLDLRMREVTNHQVNSCLAHLQLKTWLIYRDIKVAGVAKADVIDMLKEDIPDDCRIALELRQAAAKTSTAKLQAMLRGVDDDGRIRGLFQYNGAATGRWAGRRIQLHNLPRPKIDQADIESVFEILGKVSDDRGRECNNS